MAQRAKRFVQLDFIAGLAQLEEEKNQIRQMLIFLHTLLERLFAGGLATSREHEVLIGTQDETGNALQLRIVNSATSYTLAFIGTDGKTYVSDKPLSAEWIPLQFINTYKLLLPFMINLVMERCPDEGTSKYLSAVYEAAERRKLTAEPTS